MDDGTQCFARTATREDGLGVHLVEHGNLQDLLLEVSTPKPA
jgi:hypothetical protein